MKKRKRSGNEPGVFGPIFWNYCHHMAAHYPASGNPNSPDEKSQNACRLFLQSFCLLLPCSNCAGHCQLFFDANPEMVRNAPLSRNQLFYFFWALHNSVNVRLHKPLVTLEAAKKTYYFV